MDIHFNTGRSYTADGQIIRAIWDEDAETIHFADFSRACHGTIAAPTWAMSFHTPGGLALHVMEAYDRGNYKTTTESNDLLMRTGQDTSAKLHTLSL